MSKSEKNCLEDYGKDLVMTKHRFVIYCPTRLIVLFDSPSILRDHVAHFSKLDIKRLLARHPIADENELNYLFQVASILKLTHLGLTFDCLCPKKLCVLSEHSTLSPKSNGLINSISLNIHKPSLHDTQLNNVWPAIGHQLSSFKLYLPHETMEQIQLALLLTSLPELALLHLECAKDVTKKWHRRGHEQQSLSQAWYKHFAVCLKEGLAKQLRNLVCRFWIPIELVPLFKQHCPSLEQLFIQVVMTSNIVGLQQILDIWSNHDQANDCGSVKAICLKSGYRNNVYTYFKQAYSLLDWLQIDFFDLNLKSSEKEHFFPSKSRFASI